MNTQPLLILFFLSAISLGSLSGTGNNGVLGLNNSVDANDPNWVTCPQITCTIQNNFKIASDSTTFSTFDLSDISATVFPNPFTHESRLHITSRTGNLKVIIKNIQGETLYIKESHTVNEEYIFGKEFSAGMYFVQIISTEEIKTFKIIKSE